MEILAIILLLVLMPVSIIHLNNKSVQLFKYLKNEHYALWVKLGSPKRVPGIANGSKQPAFIFIFEQGYEQCEDPTVTQMCTNIVKSAKFYAISLAVIFILVLIYGTTSI
jgi:hypothetical protein